MTSEKNSPSKQGEKVGYKHPPKKNQFGQPNANPRNNGAWKKEETLRYKWEQMLKLNRAELETIRTNESASRVEQITANLLLDENIKPQDAMETLMKLANQIYGAPKIQQSIEIEDLPIPLVDLRNRKK